MRTATLFVISVGILAICACNQTPETHRINGETMGTTYSIILTGEKQTNLKKKIDSLLSDINHSVSTYIPTSVISKVNQSYANTAIAVDKHFKTNFEKSKEVHRLTNKSFNPAIMPLVNYWGFGFESAKNMESIDTTTVMTLLKLCDFDTFTLTNVPELGETVTKTMDRSKLDFSAIAKGYGVDQIAEYLLLNRYKNFVVEVGGETYAHGSHPSGRNWNVGILKPLKDNSDKDNFYISMPIKDKALATSGNYEHYRKIGNGTVIAHTINPYTGFPQSMDEEVLSSSVIATDCITADAYATAFKVMGLQESLELALRLPEIEALFIYADKEGALQYKATQGFDELIKNN